MNKFTTPDLYDEHRDSVQVADSGLQHFGNKTTFSGQVVTVTCPDDNSFAAEILHQNGVGKVLVINGFASKRFAFIGDIMAERALKNGWEGIVINGCCRDIEILATLNLPIMALGSTPRSTLKRGCGENNQAIAMLSVCIEPNDWLYADVNGLIVSKHKLS
ncbi:putative 4-hydroxy-4-methyl-2-oxoglutarate aldolase [Pseudoalteromonas sp. JB197]|uniref:putative 4-hydroxy-4-methyl-2-oxoglutarate aldolase n=1 Tax=Pseudoalteromonas sp. JB197 TaxID=1434839 RepID=UPI00097ECD18|nr:putative 4-hydroxy-4-methyl-2-oxoglutarate aldolase [Pseudoalteromonas sp. JB197]PCC10239.1 ribonuclease regulator [Pseudoalteromonas sp. JB197]SJN43462.1 Ribonuclease E inhibitor RraA [Pseudoalteromonas sp. JB197]